MAELTDVNQALNLIERAVQEKGADHRASTFRGGCVYFEADGEYEGEDYVITVYPDQPSCIVGHVFSYIGFTFDNQELNEKTVDWFLDNDNADVVISQDVFQILNAAQAVQDKGNPWSKSLEAAKRMAEIIEEEVTA